MGAEAITMFRGEYSFLSNFYILETPLPENAIFKTRSHPLFYFASSEHAYVACKTDNEEIRRYIASLYKPGEVKRYGRSIDIVDNWDDIRQACMWDVLYAKFTFNPHLKEKLLATGERELVEGNWHGDKYWGVCMRTGEGSNHLGRMLMELRDYFRDIEE
jgi:ribA/ribD-fused uncharacterized protein